MKIKITTTQNGFVWWFTGNEGKTDEAETSIDIDDLMRKLKRRVSVEVEEKRIVE